MNKCISVFGINRKNKVENSILIFYYINISHTSRRTTLYEVNTSEKFEKNPEKNQKKKLQKLDLTCVLGIIRKSFVEEFNFL
jgi:hypothetical protein